MKRLVAVSNRVGPVRGTASAGGLAIALVEALRERRGLWFGWSGRTCEHAAAPLQVRHVNGLTLATVDLNHRDFDNYYNGFSNSCIWPLFHFRVDLMHYDTAQLEGYRLVNAQFARALQPQLDSDDLIWVHDYQLFPMASELRALQVKQRIGFFLHIPFPPLDLLAALPCHKWLVRCLFDYDLVGLQTQQDLCRFHDYIRRVARGHIKGDLVTAYGRKIKVRAFPIGIDTEHFHKLAFSAQGEQEFTRMRKALNQRAQIIGVDRLDYSKGLLRRMAAFEMLLDQHPETQGKIELLQVAPISRGEVGEYRDFRKELEHAAAHINGRFSQFDWTPVHYLNRALPRRTIAGLYRASRIAFVTPVRDGMNLVAKEYVAAQDPDDPGVLVLSRFAGAAQQMTAALQVNPYHTAQVADALEQARTMAIGERRERHSELMRGLNSHNASRWRNDFCSALARSRSLTA